MKNFGNQFQNLGMKISNNNQNFRIQMQNIRSQKSKMAMRIFNIGINISNMNKIKQSNEFQNQMLQMQMMNNNMMNNNMMNKNNQLIRMNNNNYNNNEILDESKEIKKAIIFEDTTGRKTLIIISIDKTIKELINLYISKTGYDINKIQFLYNAETIYPNDKRKIKDSNFINGSIFTVIIN